MSGEWESGKPPNEEWVIVLDGTDIVEAMAYYGRDGSLPHWKLRDGSCLPADAFNKLMLIHGD